MRAVVFDLDNCLSDDGWRIDMINFGVSDVVARYDRYHRMCIHDLPRNTDKLQEAAKGVEIVLFSTSRPEYVRGATDAWIRLHLLSPSEFDFRLMMRKNGDERPSPEVKQTHLVRARAVHGIKPSDIVMAYDDRYDVLKMYAANGVACQRLFINEIAQERTEKVS